MSDLTIIMSLYAAVTLGVMVIAALIALDTDSRLAARVALTAWAWPIWLAGWLVWLVIELSAIARGPR